MTSILMHIDGCGQVAIYLSLLPQNEPPNHPRSAPKLALKKHLANLCVCSFPTKPQKTSPRQTRINMASLPINLNRSTMPAVYKLHLSRRTKVMKSQWQMISILSLPFCSCKTCFWQDTHASLARWRPRHLGPTRVVWHPLHWGQRLQNAITIRWTASHNIQVNFGGKWKKANAGVPNLLQPVTRAYNK